MTSRCCKQNMKNTKRKPPAKDQFIIACLFLMLLWPSIISAKASPEKRHQIQEILSGPVYTLELDASINPGSKAVVDRAIAVAESNNAACLVIFLDTPGGLVATLRKMVQAVMQSEVPIIVYVYPPGARAASAGAILTLSAHIAAMAPGTNIGAAHPVNLGSGSDGNSTMGKKIENDLAALAISIAAKRGRNTKWAEEAVRKSRSVSALIALKLHVIDLVASDLSDLLKKVQGRQVELKGGRKVEIHPDVSRIIPIRQSLREKILELIADPNVAYVLMMIGMVGLYFELAHPGAIFPGTVGAISLVLAFYALQALPASTTGVLLVILAFVLFVLELFIVSHGLLAISGTCALILGSLMLFDTNATGIAIDASVLWPTVLAVSLFLATICYLAAKAVLSRPKTGSEGLIGEKGIVKQDLGQGAYMVFIHGELWRAYSSHPIYVGQGVIVEAVEGLTLKIKPVED